MRRLAISMAVGALAICAVDGVAIGQPLPVPLNEIMPRLPPVPTPTPLKQPAGLCRFSATVIPMGDVVPATRAKETPDGIALYGRANNKPSGTAESPPCPIQ
jgi:hypothetical protein